jgi:Domain of unknown function (DUF5979)
LYPADVSAQQPARLPALNLGDAVVTGFSGTLPPDSAKPRPANKSAIDLTFINPDGPSARIVGLGRPGHVWDGRLIQAPKTFDVLAKDVGQVFGVALDDATPPNIYLAATSVFGLNIVSRGRDGTPERRKKGGPGAVWMKGQFGLELQGGPGAIYKVDGRTGVVSLFANVTLDGVPNPGPGLGNLAYDSAHKQLFVSDLYTGMIHRFALDGRDLGPPFDHGVSGRPTRGNVPAQAFNPRRRLNIANARFDSEDPNSWDLAPPARRVWALAVHEDRLYYSARNGAPTNGPQIWSVGIERDGNFAADPRWELDVPGEPGPYAVSDIAFSHAGAMILAQRAAIAGAYDYSAFTQAGEPRVLRYRLKDANDPPSPSRWKLAPEEYAVGFAGDYRNTDGGVALGYGYNADGTLGAGACEAALWTTGQNLRNNPALRSQLEPGGPLVVHGLQGSPANLVRNANTPPTISYFIDYDDKFDDASASGHIGSVRVYTTPCAPAAYAQPVANFTPITPIVVPGGCVGPNCGQVCTPTCVCPPGTVLEGKECVKGCPPPQVLNPATGSCMCPQGTVLRDGKCVPVIKSDIACKPPMVQIPGGACACPTGTVPVDGQCVPVQCQPPMVVGRDGICACPPGSMLQGRKCVPQICPAPLVPGPCCPPGTVFNGKECSKKVGEVIFTKKVVYDGAILLPSQPYPVTVTCGGNTTVLNLLPNVPQTVGNLPYGTTCTYNEPTPPVPPNACPPRSIGVWSTVFTPSPPITINAPTTSVLVTNTLVCKTREIGQLSVSKKVSPDPRGIGTTLSFPMTVNCTNPTGTYAVTVNGNTSSVPFNVPVGSVCTVTEVQPPLPAGCTWLPPTTASVTIHVGLNQTMVTNAYRCRGCPPPQVMNADGYCACPPPMVPGPVAGTCNCPDGMQLVNGKCVPVTTTCVPPMVLNAAGVCSCPRGTVQEGKECVKRVVCKPPLIPNAAGTSCVCPDGEVLRRGKCVERERPKKEKRRITCKRGYVWNGDMCVKRKTEPRNENQRERPGTVFPGFGGHVGGGSRGGGEGGTPGRR